MTQIGMFAATRAQGPPSEALAAELAQGRKLALGALPRAPAADWALPDAYDAAYVHLLVRHTPTGLLAGAARLSPAPQTPAEWQAGAYYCPRVFKLAEAPLHGALGPFMELGRLWVAPAWQSRGQVLRMLWHLVDAELLATANALGIMPNLLGALDLPPAFGNAHQLVLAYLAARHADPLLATQCSPTRNLLPASADASAILAGHDIRDIGALRKVLQALGAPWALPVLLRMYMQWNAMALCAQPNGLPPHAPELLLALVPGRIPSEMRLRFLPLAERWLNVGCS